MFLASFLSSSLTSKLKNEKKLSQEKTNHVLLVEAINHSFQVNDLHTALVSSMNLIAENCDAYCELSVHINQTNFEDQSSNSTSILNYEFLKPIIVNKEEVGKLKLSSQFPISENWISTIGDILSQNIERHDLVEKQSLAQLQIREQKIRNDLLSAISHDLRTPLATIVGSSDTLLENLDKLNQSEQKELLMNIKTDSVWLINSVENILSFMRVEEGINLKLQIESVEELFGDILSRMVNRVPQRLVLDLPSEPIYAKVVSAYTITSKITDFVMLPMVNLGIGMTVFTAQNVGAFQYDRVKQAHLNMLKITLSFGLIMAILVSLFGNQLISLFLGENLTQEILEVGRVYLYYSAITFFFMAILFPAESLLKGAGDINMFLFIAITGSFTKIVAALILIPYFGVQGIWFGIAFGWFVEMSLTLYRYRSNKWIHKRLKEV